MGTMRKNKKTALLIILSLCILLCISGCENRLPETIGRGVTPVAEDEDVKADEPGLRSEEGKEFYIIRLRDIYYRIQVSDTPGMGARLEPLYTENGDPYTAQMQKDELGIPDGVAALIKADVDINNNAFFVKKRNSLETVDYHELFITCNIEDFNQKAIGSRYPVLKYENMADNYLLICEGKEVLVYNNGSYQTSQRRLPQYNTRRFIFCVGRYCRVCCRPHDPIDQVWRLRCIKTAVF